MNYAEYRLDAINTKVFQIKISSEYEPNLPELYKTGKYMPPQDNFPGILSTAITVAGMIDAIFNEFHFTLQDKDDAFEIESLCRNYIEHLDKVLHVDPENIEVLSAKSRTAVLLKEMEDTTSLLKRRIGDGDSSNKSPFEVFADNEERIKDDKLAHYSEEVQDAIREVFRNI